MSTKITKGSMTSSMCIKNKFVLLTNMFSMFRDIMGEVKGTEVDWKYLFANATEEEMNGLLKDVCLHRSMAADIEEQLKELERCAKLIKNTNRKKG